MEKNVMERTHVSQRFLGFTIVLLLMFSVSMAFGTSTPPTVNNGNEISAVTVTPSATIVHANGMIMDATTNVTITFDVFDVVTYSAGNANLDLITADIANLITAQITQEVAATATYITYMKTNGKDVDGATVITRNPATDTAKNNGTSTSIIALVSPVTGNNSEGIQICGATAGAMNGVYLYPVEVAFVLKAPISADANFVSVTAGYDVAIHVDLSGTATMTQKILSNFFVANTGASTPNVLSTVNSSAFNTPTASATIGNPISLAGQTVRTLVQANLNQAAIYRMTLVTDQMVNQEGIADANELVSVAVANNTLLAARTAGNTGTETKTLAGNNTPDANVTDITAIATTMFATSERTTAVGITAAGLARNAA